MQQLVAGPAGRPGRPAAPLAAGAGNSGDAPAAPCPPSARDRPDTRDSATLPAQVTMKKSLIFLLNLTARIVDPDPIRMDQL